MKKIKVIFLILIIVLSLKTVKAEENTKEVSKQVSTEETSTYYNHLTTIRTTFYNEGIVVYTRNTIRENNLFYYNLDGTVIKRLRLQDLTKDEEIYIKYMDAHNEYLYLITNKGMYKLNSSLEIISYNEEVSYLYKFPAEDVENRLEYGVKQMEFAEDGIYLPNKYFIDYDLKELKETEDEDRYIYSEDDTLTDWLMLPYYGLKSLCEVDSFSDLWSCDRNGEYTIASRGRDNGYATLMLYKNGEKQWTIENEDYNIFMYTKFYNDIIITVAGKYDGNIYNYKSDILFYDLEGNYLGKIEDNQLLSYLTVSEEKFALGREVIDGICTKDKYNMSDSGCDSITNFEVYALGTSKVNPPEDGDSSGITITNPETSSHKLIYLIIILFGSLSIGLILRKKIKIN